MISTLALFLPSNERARCRYVKKDQHYPFHPDLLVQGAVCVSLNETLSRVLNNFMCLSCVWLFQECDEALSELLREAGTSGHPLTLVDMLGMQVKLSTPLPACVGGNESDVTTDRCSLCSSNAHNIVQLTRVL